MEHLTVGLFKNSTQAGRAIAELKTSPFTKDISLITRNAETGKIHMYQVKEKQGEEEKAGSILGAEIGMIVGIIGGISTIISPEFSGLGMMGSLAAAMGVAGAALGATAGGFLGSLDDAGLPPERAKMYKDRIKAGEVFVSVSTTQKEDPGLLSIFAKHKASDIHTMSSKT